MVVLVGDDPASRCSVEAVKRKYKHNYNWCRYYLNIFKSIILVKAGKIKLPDLKSSPSGSS